MCNLCFLIIPHKVFLPVMSDLKETCDGAYKSEIVRSPLSSSDDTHRVTNDSSRERESRVILQHTVEEGYTEDEHEDGSTSSKWQRRAGGTDFTVTGVCDVSVCVCADVWVEDTLCISVLCCTAVFPFDLTTRDFALSSSSFTDILYIFEFVFGTKIHHTVTILCCLEGRNVTH